MRKLGRMDHDECAPWCNHDPRLHTEDCESSFCDGYECWESEGKPRNWKIVDYTLVLLEP
jgi:hypothetical protein